VSSRSETATKIESLQDTDILDTIDTWHCLPVIRSYEIIEHWTTSVKGIFSTSRSHVCQADNLRSVPRRPSFHQPCAAVRSLSRRPRAENWPAPVTTTHLSGQRRYDG
jgi:hypothetical protein